MSNAIKRIWNITTTIAVILVVILALLLVGARLVGFQVFAVLSGSMEPTYQTGSLIYVKEVDPFSLEPGDAITFMMDKDTTATHRIVGVVPDEEDSSVIRFRTKGDANDYEDATLVHYKNVIGVPKFTIPKLGYISNFIQHPPGMYYAIAMAVVLLLLSFLPDLLEDDKEPKEKRQKPEKKKKSDRPAAPPAPSIRSASRDAKMYEMLYGTETLPEEKPKTRKNISPSVGRSNKPPVEKKPAANPPRPKRPAPVMKEEMSFDLDDILREFRSE